MELHMAGEPGAVAATARCTAASFLYLIAKALCIERMFKVHRLTIAMLLAISSSPAFVARPAVSLRAFRAAGRRPSDPRRRDKQTTSPPAAAVASAAWPPEERQEGRRPGSGSPARQVQRALGLDYGRRVVGLAVSTLGLAPRPLEGLPGCGLDGQVALAAAVLEIARRESCDAVVVGLPVTQAGSLRKRDTDSQQGRRCRNFALNLAAAAEGPAGGSGGNGGSSIRVFLADERGSTLEARHVLASSGRRSSAFGKVR